MKADEDTRQVLLVLPFIVGMFSLWVCGGGWRKGRTSVKRTGTRSMNDRVEARMKLERRGGGGAGTLEHLAEAERGRATNKSAVV